MRRVAVVVVAVGLTTSACMEPGGLTSVGRTGVTSVEGDLAVVWDSCGQEPVAVVVLHRGRRGLAPGEDEPLIGTWKLGERNRQEKVFVPAAADDPPELDPAEGYFAQVVPEGGVETLAGVHFTLDAVARLGADEVLVAADGGSMVGTWDDLAVC